MIPDNYDMWEAQDIERERRRARLPVCETCGEPIQDEHFYDINDEFICEECLKNNFRKNTEDYCE